MALDPVPTYPGQYDSLETNNNPSGSETRREGDDQIRRMKASEKATWTNVTGAVTSSHEELNRLTGISLTDPITTFPSGTKMVFYQASAPTGWTIDVSVDQHGINLVSAGGGVTTGTIDFDTIFKSHPEGGADGVQDHTLTNAELPTVNLDHGHTTILRSGTPLSTGGSTTYLGSAASIYRLSGTASNNNTIIEDTSGLGFGSDTPHGHSLNLAMKRALCIVATKD